MSHDAVQDGEGGRQDGSAVGLKPNAIGFVDALVIGLNATSPPTPWPP